MTLPKLQRSLLEPARYDYLNVKDSELYDKVKNSNEPNDKEIARLLCDKAASSEAGHRNSFY